MIRKATQMSQTVFHRLPGRMMSGGSLGGSSPSTITVPGGALLGIRQLIILAIVARMHPHRVRDPPLDAEAPPRKLPPALKTSLELPTDLLIGLMLCCLVRAGGMAKLFCDALCSRSLASPVPPPCRRFTAMFDPTAASIPGPAEVNSCDSRSRLFCCDLRLSLEITLAELAAAHSIQPQRHEPSRRTEARRDELRFLRRLFSSVATQGMCMPAPRGDYLFVRFPCRF